MIIRECAKTNVGVVSQGKNSISVNVKQGNKNTNCLPKSETVNILERLRLCLHDARTKKCRLIFSRFALFAR